MTCYLDDWISNDWISDDWTSECVLSRQVARTQGCNSLNIEIRRLIRLTDSASGL